MDESLIIKSILLLKVLATAIKENKSFSDDIEGLELVLLELWSENQVAGKKIQELEGKVESLNHFMGVQ